jgi:hypothetical protein
MPPPRVATATFLELFAASMACGQPTNLVREEAGSRRREFRWSEGGPEGEGQGWRVREEEGSRHE